MEPYVLGDKLLNQFKGAYRHAPYFEQTFPLIEQIVRLTLDAHSLQELDRKHYKEEENRNDTGYCHTGKPAN